MSDQYELTSTFCARPQQFAWFIGAGTSAAAGLPTAWDIIWDLKRRYYCREENQDISRQDVQLAAIRTRIQAYMLSNGFPNEGDPDEYTTYSRKYLDRTRSVSGNTSPPFSPKTKSLFQLATEFLARF
jgi:hypothetical protein